MKTKTSLLLTIGGFSLTAVNAAFAEATGHCGTSPFIRTFFWHSLKAAPERIFGRFNNRFVRTVILMLALLSNTDRASAQGQTLPVYHVDQFGPSPDQTALLANAL